MKRVVIYTALAGLVGVATGTGTAQAQDDRDSAEADVTEERQMTLPAGRIFVQGFVEINLSEDQALEPLSIAPDLWYGVSDLLTVGLVHSGRAATGFFGGSGNGLCLTGEENGCGEVYDNIGLDARYHFYREGGITAAADGGLFVSSFDPFQLAIKLGLVGRWQSGMMAVELAPSLFAGLTEREPEAEVGVALETNKEIFYLPATFIYALNAKIGLAGQAGVVVPFNETGDVWTFALSFGAQYMVNEKIFADAAFSLPALAGGELIDTGANIRTFTLGVGYAL